MEELYRQSVKTVYGFVYSLCGNDELARDITQETFLKAIESIHRYNGQCKFSVWLCQIARHLWYQYLSKSGREIPSGDDIYSLADRRLSESAEDALIRQEDVRDVFSIISRMSKDTGEVMLLRLLFEMSFKEIGFILGRSENWARVTYYRGKERLLRKWEEENGS